MIQSEYGLAQSVRLNKTEVKVRVETAFADLEEVKKPISVFASAHLISVTPNGESVNAKAKVTFTFVYLSEDGYKKAVLDADASADILSKDCTVSVRASDVKLVMQNGYNAVCNLIFVGESRAISQKNVLIGGENLFVKKVEEKCDVYYGNKFGQQTVSEEFEVDFTIGEVLYYGATPYLTSVTSGLGRIILEGEILLTVKALPFSENNDIVKESKVIPFRYELECDDCLSDMRSFARVEVLSTNVKIYADEGRQKSSINADITLSFSGCSVGEENVGVVLDAYSKLYDCEVVTEKIAFRTFKEQKRFKEKVVGSGCVAPLGGRILSTLGESVTVLSVKKVEERYTVEGFIKTDVIFKNADNGITSMPCETPFAFEFVEDGDVDLVNVKLTELVARIKNGEVEIEGYLRVCYNAYNIAERSCAVEVNEIGERKNRGGAISVCIAKKNDDLWEVAKTLGATEEEIERFNPDLEFPLQKEERIILYKQKI